MVLNLFVFVDLILFSTHVHNIEKNIQKNSSRVMFRSSDLLIIDISGVLKFPFFNQKEKMRKKTQKKRADRLQTS